MLAALNVRNLILVVYGMLLASSAMAQIVQIECHVQGSSSSGKRGTEWTSFNETEAYGITLEYDGDSIRVVNSKSPIVYFSNAHEEDGVITASERSPLDEEVVESVTLDRRSGRLHEVQFTKEEVLNVFYVCIFPKE